jgi:hypothetical protein
MATSLRLSLVLAALAAVWPATALATPPVSETIAFDDTVTYAAGSDQNPCPFDVEFRNQGAMIVTTYFDASGAPVRQLARGSHIVETFSANRKSISSHSPSVGHVELTANVAVITGNQRHFIVPSVGIVYARAGRVVVDLTDGSVISCTGLDVPAGGEICAALAP